jgi:CheY-like chemotaxis protein
MKAQKILIVEDNFDIRSTLVEILNLEGHPTIEASNGAVALQYIKNDKNPKPSMVLLDMMMPVMDGRAFLDALKEDPKNALVPVIIISAVADKVDTSGANECLGKPMDINDLLNVIEKYS